MQEVKGGCLSPPSRVTVSTSKAGITTHTDRAGNVTLLELIDIQVVWGSREGDRWRGVLVREPYVLEVLEKIRKKSSSQSAKLYALKLSELIFFDYRYGSCEKIFTAGDNTRYPCNAPIVLPGLDGYKCFKCGYVQKADFSAVATTKKASRKQKKIEQVPLEALPASQLDLFAPEVKPEQLKEEVVRVWTTPTEEDYEAAHLELLESYLDD